MPVKVVKRNGKHRIVEESTGQIAKTENGVARDGGGHISPEKAHIQASHMNKAYKKKKKKKKKR